MPSNNSSPDLTKQRLTDLRNGLLSLHKTLLDSERASYERDIARIGSSGELLEAGALRSMVRVAARAVGVRGANR
jgi:hypothetical protein